MTIERITPRASDACRRIRLRCSAWIGAACRGTRSGVDALKPMRILPDHADTVRQKQVDEIVRWFRRQQQCTAPVLDKSRVVEDLPQSRAHVGARSGALSLKELAGSPIEAVCEERLPVREADPVTHGVAAPRRKPFAVFANE